MKWDKYLPIALSINFLVTLSYIFENVIKILTGRKFYISFLLEVALSSGETMAILASSGKMVFDKLLFIALGNGWQKTLAAIFTSLVGIISKATAFYVTCNQNFKCFFWICSRSIARRCNSEDLIFRSSRNTIDARRI